jgi:hypothetical protein
MFLAFAPRLQVLTNHLDITLLLIALTTLFLSFLARISSKRLLSALGSLRALPIIMWVFCVVGNFYLLCNPNTPSFFNWTAAACAISLIVSYYVFYSDGLTDNEIN